MRHRTKSLLPTALLLALTAATVIQAVAPATRFALGILRRDGRIVPFASYEDGKWRNRWPTILQRQEEVPLALKYVPDGWWPWREPLLTWKTWPLEGQGREITVLAPELLDVQCSRGMALKTDYQPFAGLLPRRTQPYPKDGLVTAGTVTVEPVETLTAESAEWPVLEQALRAEVSRMENRSVDEWAGTWKHPVSRGDRGRTAVSLEVLCRSRAAEPGATVYFFEAIKKYPLRPEWNTKLPSNCDLITFATGWIIWRPKERPKMYVSTELTNCTRDGLAYTLPLGVITINDARSWVQYKDRRYWVVQVSGRGYEHYEVLEPTLAAVNRPLLTVGGACR